MTQNVRNERARRKVLTGNGYDAYRDCLRALQARAHGFVTFDPLDPARANQNRAWLALTCADGSTAAYGPQPERRPGNRVGPARTAPLLRHEPEKPLVYGTHGPGDPSCRGCGDPTLESQQRLRVCSRALSALHEVF